ncbi:hypothetical protein [Mycobacterium sp.]|uniref:hypothetical protein n=1 Tax=Mycobacterium sp. TaxID=1785 RepID=UPI003D0B7CC1
MTATQLTPDELRQARAKAFWSWAKSDPQTALASFHGKPAATFADGKYPAAWFTPPRKPKPLPRHRRRIRSTAETRQRRAARYRRA